MTSSWYEVRDALETDAPHIAAHRFDSTWGDEARRASLSGAYAQWLPPVIRSGRYVGRIAECEGRVIAGAGAVLLDWGATWYDPNPVKARLVNVFTAQEYRRRGVARRLVSEVIGELRGRGIVSVSLAATDEGAALYESLGFERRGNEFALRY